MATPTDDQLAARAEMEAHARRMAEKGTADHWAAVAEIDRLCLLYGISVAHHRTIFTAPTGPVFRVGGLVAYPLRLAELRRWIESIAIL